MPKDGPIYGKYHVSRVDGRDQAGGDKDDAKYFVLDLAHDRYAREAMMYYAFKCVDEFPELAADIWKQLKVDISTLNYISTEIPVVKKRSINGGESQSS